MINISGCDCLIQAIYHNGLIKGQVSVALTSEQLKFDLQPALNERFQAVNIFNECKRLYFDVDYNDQGHLFLKLSIKTKSQYVGTKNTKQNFILKLEGSKNQISSLTITNDRSNNQLVF